MNDVISLVVPVYNVQNYLERCISSLVNQTYHNIEIILVDDGSTDDSGKICDIWKGKDSRIKVIHKNNGGLSSARNEGLKYITGDYVMFVDSDDYISEETIEETFDMLKQNNADIIITNRVHFYDNNKKIVKYKQMDNVLVMNSEQAIKEMNYNRYFDMCANCKLYKSSLFSEIKFPVGKLSEDMYIMYRIFDKANKIVYYSKPLYYYYQRTGSISKNPTINYDYIQAFKEQMKYIEDKYPNLLNLTKATYALSYMTVYNIVIVNGGKPKKEVIGSFKRNVRDGLKNIFKENNIKKSRKIQSIIFITNIHLYNIMIKIYKKK